MFLTLRASTPWVVSTPRGMPVCPASLLATIVLKQLRPHFDFSKAPLNGNSCEGKPPLAYQYARLQHFTRCRKFQCLLRAGEKLDARVIRALSCL